MNIGQKTLALVSGLVTMSVIGFFVFSFFPVSADPGDPGTIDTAFDAGGGFDTSFAYDILFEDASSTIFLGGDFGSYDSNTRDGVARINTDGTIDTSFNHATTGFTGTGGTSRVWSAAIDANNKYILAGGFTSYEGTTRRGIARLNRDGTLDTSFDPGVGLTSSVNAQDVLIEPGGKIVVGGNFTLYDSNSQNYITRINSDGSIDATFNSGSGFDSTVTNLAIDSNGDIYALGDFTTYNGTSTPDIVRLNTDGTIDTAFDMGTGFTGVVQALAVDGDDKVLVGGAFTNYDGTSAVGLIRLNTDGTIDNSFDPGTGPSSNVKSIAFDSSGKIIIVGDFNLYDGSTADGIARINTDGSFDSTFDMGTGFTGGSVFTVAVDSNDDIFVSGTFTGYDGTSANNLVKINGGELPKEISYSTTTFSEAVANDGSITDTATLTLSGDTFTVTSGAMTLNTHYTATNVPSGLTMVVTGTASTTATVGFSGNADSHENTDDVSNVGLTFLDAAFTGGDASAVTGGSTSTIVIDFDDAALTDHFVTTWKPDNSGTSGSTSITIPTTGSGYDYDVDWDNDGTFDQFGITGDVTHDFGSSATTTIRIKGDFPRIYFNNGGDRQKILSVDQWGNQVWTSMENSFWGASNLEINATDNPDLSSVASMAHMFHGASSMNQDIGDWDVSNVTNMSYLFADSPFNQDISSWDVSNVVYLNRTFQGNTAFDQDIGGWDVSSVISMQGLFTNATAFNQDISTWTTSSTTLMNSVFSGASAFNQDISSWDTSNVTSMNSMFINADSFDQDLSSWNVTSLTDAGQMFKYITLSTANYDALLIGWEAQSLQFDVDFDGGYSARCFGESARANMISSDSWNISDGGLNCGSLVYSTEIFEEAVANDGSISTTATINLSTSSINTFTATSTVMTSGVHYTSAFVPSGLTMVVTGTSATTTEVTLTGNASSHEDADDISNMRLIFLDAAFANGDASYVTGYSNTGLEVDFDDAPLAPEISYSTTTFSEAVANDGSITDTATLTLVDDTFTVTGGAMTLNTHYTATNVPSGLTMVVTGTSATTTTVGFSGNASSHEDANDVSNVELTFLDAAFTGGSASSVTGYSNTGLSIDFDDAASLSYSGNFTEAGVNDGSVTGSRVATLTGDTFVNAGSTLTETTHFALTNKPTGLTAVMNVNGGGTEATLTFTGNAAAHENVNDVSDLTITFLDAAFTGGDASAVTNYTDANGSIDFNDAQSLSYSTTEFVETSANNGAVVPLSFSNEMLLTLSGDTFTVTGGAMTLNTHYTATNVPSGLTMVVTGTASTTATVELSGNADSHENSDDISNLTLVFLDAAFTGGSASSVTGYSNTSLSIDFDDEEEGGGFEYVNPPQCHFTAPQTVTYGDSIELDWHVAWTGPASPFWYKLNGQVYAPWSNGPTLELGHNLYPELGEEEFTYYLEAINLFGATFCDQTITIVQPEPEPLPDPLACSADVSPSQVYVGDEAIVSWNVQGGVPPYTGPEGETLTSPQIFLAEEEGPYQFQIEVVDQEGVEVSCSADILVLPEPDPQPEDFPPLSCQATATPSAITEGDSTDIAWTIAGGKSPYLAYFNSQGFPVSQPYTITPTDNEVYSIYVKDDLGSVSECYVGVTVYSNEEIDPEPEQEIFGCVDPSALNYNSQATTSNNSCVYQEDDNDDDIIVYPGDDTPEPDPQPEPTPLPQPTEGGITFRTVDLANFLSQPETRIGTVAALAIGIITAIAGAFASPLAGSELFLLPARLWNIFLTALGIRKKDRKWGTVYDAKTKQPLDPVHVVLTNIQTGEKQTTITDMDGRYTFLVDNPGTYRLTANKAQYSFPSQSLKGKEEDHLYKNLYHGGAFQVAEGGQVITKNIPLDPEGVNWNEQDKLNNNRLKFFKRRDYILTKLADTLFYAGFVLAVLALVFFPAPFNIATFALYVVFALIRRTGYGGRPTGDVVDGEGNPIPHAVLRLISPTLGQEIKHTVADKYGRYHLLANNGEYDLKVEHPESHIEDMHVPKKERQERVTVTKGYYKEKVSL